MLFLGICVRNSVFSREFAHKFPQPGGNLKISEGIRKFPRVKPEGNFLIPEDIFKFTTGKGIYAENHEKKTEFLANFFIIMINQDEIRI